MSATLPASIADAAAAISAGRVRCADLLEAHLRRIAELEDRIHAWVFVDEDGARLAADERDRELGEGHSRGPLHGIPIGIKDIVDVAGWPTRAGSTVTADTPVATDAPLVANLRRAGAVILGKTVTTEFACFDPAPTCNPWRADRTPGGSSSGSAAAVATRMCLGAVGSQTGGSITRPASFCGICGCKPSFGRVSLAGVVPVSFHLDHPGPMARTVADLAIMLAAMCGDETISFERKDAGQPPRLGVLRQFFFTHADAAVRDVAEGAIARLCAAGAQVEDAPLPESFDDALLMHRRIMAVDAAAYHRATFGRQRQAYGAQITALIDDGMSTSAVDYCDALAHQIRFRQDIGRTVAAYDAVITPATVTTAPGRETTGDPRFNAPWSYCGLPTVSLPCGLAADGLPVAVQLAATAMSDFELLSVAAWCEQQINFAADPPVVA